MPLSVLVPLIIVGLTLVFFAVRRSGGSEENPPLSATDIRERLAIDFPNERIEEINIAGSGKLALVQLAGQDNWALVKQMGHHNLTRQFSSAFVNSVSKSPEGLIIRLKDFTLPEITFDCPPQIGDQLAGQLKGTD